jgi:hypothetical protein
MYQTNIKILPVTVRMRIYILLTSSQYNQFFWSLLHKDKIISSDYLIIELHLRIKNSLYRFVNNLIFISLQSNFG